MNLKELAAEYGVRNLRFFIPLSKLQYAGFIPGIAFRTNGQGIIGFTKMIRGVV